MSSKRVGGGCVRSCARRITHFVANCEGDGGCVVTELEEDLAGGNNVLHIVVALHKDVVQRCQHLSNAGEL